MQVGTHVGKIVDPDSEATSHRSKRVAHGALVFAKRPRSASPLARKNDVHRTPHADGALELTAAPPDGAAMLGARELSVNVAGEK